MNEIKKDIHIKWLSKAETAVINGSEMTVLPYGYLTQAVEEAIQKRNEEINKICDDHAKDWGTSYSPMMELISKLKK